MFATAGIAILVVMALTLLRAIVGPSLYDRVLAVNTFGTATVLLIAVMGFIDERPEFMDVAMVYALINFVG
ncbi:MAG: monovalent cation/H+ antiporter complex subunit F, partial [Verrucomicrobiota bacterium]